MMKETNAFNKQPKPLRRVVLIGKAKGQSWEDFENYCVETLRKAGFLKD